MHDLSVVHHADVDLEVSIDVEVTHEFAIEEGVCALRDHAAAGCRAVRNTHEGIAAVIGCAREHAAQKGIFLGQHAQRQIAAVADQWADDLPLLKRHHQHGCKVILEMVIVDIQYRLYRNTTEKYSIQITT